MDEQIKMIQTVSNLVETAKEEKRQLNFEELMFCLSICDNQTEKFQMMRALKKDSLV